MATASEALTSVKHIIEQIHMRTPSCLWDKFCKMQEVIPSLLKVLETSNTIGENFASQIDFESYKAKETITEMRDRILLQDCFYEKLQIVIKRSELIKEEVMKLHKNKEIQGSNQPRRHLMPLPSLPSPETVLVGMEDITIKIMEKLIHEHKSDHLQVSISGMGGIGKTTVALKVYQNPHIESHFHIRAWATVSKDYRTKDILVELLFRIDKPESRESLSELSENDLHYKLHKSLFARRYLVVLDDVWDVKAWNEVRSFLPASKGSRILITTRELTVASISPHGFGMNLLDEDRSWELFSNKVFEKDPCPPELEYVGRKITNN